VWICPGTVAGSCRSLPAAGIHGIALEFVVVTVHFPPRSNTVAAAAWLLVASNSDGSSSTPPMFSDTATLEPRRDSAERAAGQPGRQALPLPAARCYHSCAEEPPP
jgi:hypothetical protein